MKNMNLQITQAELSTKKTTLRHIIDLLLKTKGRKKQSLK